MQEGNNVVEYHSSEFFPERFFQAVFVVRCDNDILFKRLEQRGYNPAKIKNNCEFEIFQMALEEAQSSYKKEIIFEVRGENEEQLEENL
jgi:adenylate kinase